ncbi:MAG: hypothetical protein V9E96_10480 [Chitinophagaceae bacterium]
MLGDFDEINTYKTNPRAGDTDLDGIADGLEVAQSTDPLVPNPPTATPVDAQPDHSAADRHLDAYPVDHGDLDTHPIGHGDVDAACRRPRPRRRSPRRRPRRPSRRRCCRGWCASRPRRSSTAFYRPASGRPQPTFTFQPTVSGAARLAQVFAVRDAGRLYMAFLINDAAAEPTDSVRLYIDTTNNGGDGDTADRFFQVARDGTRLLWAGIGSNADGQEWNSNYTSSNWTAAVGEPGNGQWVVEMQIDAVAELGALADPFGLMAQVLYTGDLASYPADGRVEPGQHVAGHR